MEEEEYYYQDGVIPVPQNPAEEDNEEDKEDDAENEDEEFDFLGGEYY
jgi:hypothetical protein